MCTASICRRPRRVQCTEKDGGVVETRFARRRPGLLPEADTRTEPRMSPPRPIWTIPKCGRGSPICVYLDPLFFFKHKKHIALGWGQCTHRAPSGASQRSSLFFGHGTCSVSSNVRQCRFETQMDTCLHVISQRSLPPKRESGRDDDSARCVDFWYRHSVSGPSENKKV